MGLFSWFKKKQVEAETGSHDLPGLEGTKVIPSSPALIKENSSEVEHFHEEGAFGVDKWMGRNDHEDDHNSNYEPKIKIKAIFSNRVLTVFLPSGDIITNTGATKELLQKVQEAYTEAEIRILMLDSIGLGKEQGKNVEGIMDDQEIVEAMPEIVGTGEFVEKQGILYMNGIDVSIPKILAKEIIKAGKNDTSEYYDSLKNFWCWCVLNPDPIAREDLFGFLERGDFKITASGFFLGYRNVDEKASKKSGNSSLTAFISDKYLNIKTKQKKSPKNYDIKKFSSGAYDLVKLPYKWDINGEERVGNLADLYNGLSELEDNEYTDQYTHKMSIKIGVPVKMERSKCDSSPHSSCSRGLHIKNKHYGNGHGNISIIVAVNPMNVVAVPKGEENKMRVCEYMPLGVITGKWENWLEDADSLSIEEKYVGLEMEELHNKAKNSGVVEETGKVLVSQSLVNQALTVLDASNIIAKRVVEVK